MIVNWLKIIYNIGGSAIAAGGPVFYATGNWQLAIGAAIAAVAGNQLGLHQTPPLVKTPPSIPS